MKFKVNIIFIFFIIFISCTESEFIKKIEFGSNLNNNGKIIEDSIEYNINLNSNYKDISDFCNFVYFEGDTFCFSLTPTKLISESEISAYYKIKGKEKKHSVERIGFYKKRIYGFSLIGSILEYYFEENLDDSFIISGIPEKYDIELILEIKNKDEVQKYIFDQQIQINLIKK